MQKLNEESKFLERTSFEMLNSIKKENELNFEEEIGQYIIEMTE